MSSTTIFINTSHLDLFFFINQVILLANFLVGFGWCKVIQEPIDNRTIQDVDNQAWRIEPDEDGNYRIDDMVMDEVTFKRNFGTDEENAKLDRQGLPKGINEWPNKELPYVISSEFSYANRQKIKSAIQNFNNVFAGCFKIRSIMPWDKNWVNVRPVSGDGCSAPIGNQGRGAHDLKLNPYCCDCLEEYTIQHEFIHAIGFFHVQSRPDRDQFVTINWNNVQKGHNNHNFWKQRNSETYGVKYDPRSFMHYWWNSHALNKKYATITWKVS